MARLRVAPRRRILSLGALVPVLVMGALGLLAGGARAGTWTLVSCSQPNGQPAPTDGWSAGMWAGSGSPGSGDTNTCASGGSLTAVSSTSGQPASYTGPEWIFTAPGGATITGGSITATLTSPQGQTWIGTPDPAYDSADVIVNCQLNAACGSGGTYSGTFPIDHPDGTMIYAPALCVDFSAPTCPLVGGDAVNAEVSITRAMIELDADAVPEATGATGTLLSPGASGTAELVFTASDPGVDGGSGPGVYAVSVAIDGTTVYSGVPGDNDGACVALGTDPATNGLIFDHAQPCAQAETVTVPVNTRALSDGRHQLMVTAADAAGNAATVLDRYITTSNPHTTPRRGGAVRARLVYHYRYRGAVSHLTGLRGIGLPRGGTITAACHGPRCPSLSPARVGTGSARRLFAALARRAFHAGDRLTLTIAERGHRRERISFGFRRGRAPVVRG